MEDNKLSMTVKGGGRVLSLPGSEATIRGFSGATLIVEDEASRVPDELYMAIRPMLAVSNGRLVALSTPWGKRGWWFEAWEQGETWQRVHITAHDCPRIPAAFLEEERQNMGEWWFTQEYMCTFLDAQSSAFRREDIDRAFSKEIETWNLL